MSKYEEAALLAIKELLRDPKQYFNTIYKPAKASRDNYRWVYAGNAPAYHFNTACERLNADYINFEIPASIREKGPEVVERFRTWFKSVRHLIEDNTEAFVARLAMDWKISLHPKSVMRKNSGIIEIENYSIDELETTIDRLLSEAKAYYYRDGKTQSILKKYSKYTYLAKKSDPIQNNNTGYSDSEIKVILADYDARFKAPLKNLLIEYYRLKLNPEIRMEGYLLEQLNFRPCSCCVNKDDMTSHSLTTSPISFSVGDDQDDLPF